MPRVSQAVANAGKANLIEGAGPLGDHKVDRTAEFLHELVFELAILVLRAIGFFAFAEVNTVGIDLGGGWGEGAEAYQQAKEAYACACAVHWGLAKGWVGSIIGSKRQK